MSNSEKTLLIAAELESAQAALAAILHDVEALGVGLGVAGDIAQAFGLLERAEKRARQWAADIEE